MKFKDTHYKVTSDQPLEKIEAYLKSIGAIPCSRWNDRIKEGVAKYVILYAEGKYRFYNHAGNAAEAFIPKTPKK